MMFIMLSEKRELVHTLADYVFQVVEYVVVLNMNLLQWRGYEEGSWSAP